MESFTPVSSLLGGALIGLAASILLLFHGRVAGVAGILGETLRGDGTRGEGVFRAAFLVGLVAAGLALRAGLSRRVLRGRQLVRDEHRARRDRRRARRLRHSPRQRMHERSRRVRDESSVEAFDRGDDDFMAAGAVTVFVVRHVARSRTMTTMRPRRPHSPSSAPQPRAPSSASGSASRAWRARPRSSAFLDVAGAWDPSLAFVMVGAIGVHCSRGRRREAPRAHRARRHLPLAEASSGRQTAPGRRRRVRDRVGPRRLLSRARAPRRRVRQSRGHRLRRRDGRRHGRAARSRRAARRGSCSNQLRSGAVQRTFDA